MTLSNVTILELNKRIGKNFDGKLKLSTEDINTIIVLEERETAIEENAYESETDIIEENTIVEDIQSI